MKQIIGSPAEKDRFFLRQQIIDDIYEDLDAGNNVLISAPRRVGKTSNLLYLVDNPVADYYMIHVVTESITGGNQFFKALLDAIIDSDSLDRYGKFGAKTMGYLKDFASKFRSISISDGAIDMSRNSKIDYFKEFKKFLKGIELEGKKIILMVDEFPITVENVINEHGNKAGLLFLKQNRELRQDVKIKKKLKFIYTGSIGLYSIVKGINATTEINDLKEIHIPQLSRDEATDFSKQLFSEYKIRISKEMLSYMLDKVEWLIPFHIQLMVKEIRDLQLQKKSAIDKAYLDKAFRQVIKNGNIYFDHYRGRLSKVFDKNELKFINEFLTALSTKKQMSDEEVTNLAAKRRVDDKLKNILESLIYDGYIMETEDETAYRFYSPILKNWWKKNV